MGGGEGVRGFGAVRRILPASVVGHPASGAIWLDLNGERRQSGDLNQMIWKVPEMISYFSGPVHARPRRPDLLRNAVRCRPGPARRHPDRPHRRIGDIGGARCLSNRTSLAGSQPAQPVRRRSSRPSVRRSPMAASAPDAANGRATERARHRPRRPRRDRAAERAGDGDRLRLGRRGGDHRAAQSGLSRRRARLLPDRHRREGDPRRRDEAGAGGRRSPNASASRFCRLDVGSGDGPAGAFTIEGAPIGDRGARTGRGRTTSRSSSTPRARPRGRSSCRCSQPMSPPPPATSARRWRSPPEDRCLNIMPLFHIHGLIAAVLSSLAAGGSVVCTPGFNALTFFALAR